MCDDYPIWKGLFLTRHEADSLKSNICNTIVESKRAGQVEIDEGRISAGDGRDAPLYARDNLDYRTWFGFVGHDGAAWLWDARKQCWRHIRESSPVSSSSASALGQAGRVSY